MQERNKGKKKKIQIYFQFKEGKTAKVGQISKTVSQWFDQMSAGSVLGHI